MPEELQIDIQTEIEELLKDLNLDKLPEAEQQRALAMLSERYQTLVSNTFELLATPEQKRQFEQALKDPKTMEEKITEIAAQVPGFLGALEEAFLKEHEFLKMTMGMKE